MTWTFAKVAAAGALTVIPLVAVGIPAYAAENPHGAPTVLPAPADPATDPAPPNVPGHHGEYYSTNDYNDWNNWYNGGADGGGGGGGG